MSNHPSVPYSIRESARARYLRFRVTLDKGLEVVVPRGYDRRRIPELLHHASIVGRGPTHDKRRQVANGW